MLTKTGAKMEAGQDERGQALFKLCRHWKKSPVKARKHFFYSNKPEEGAAGNAAPGDPASCLCRLVHFHSPQQLLGPRSMQMPPPGEEPERALAFLRERAGVEGLLDKFKNIKGSNGHE